MIFVTVGTHEQQFNRLIEEVDSLIKKEVIKDKVIMQTGYCTYTPHFCEYKKYFSYSEMERYFRDADKVVCHGGPSTFMSVINQGKIPIVVPSLLEYEEHVSNQQLEFARKVRERGYPILLVENILELKKYLFEIDINIKKNINEYKVTSNNVKFVTDFIDLLKN